MPLSPSQSAQIPLIAPISSLLKPASVCLAALNFHSLSGQQGVQRNQGDPVRESESWETAKSLQFWNCTGSVENLARSPTSRFATNVVALSLYLWTPWNLGLLHIFSTAYYCFVAQRSWNPACQCRPCQCEGPSSRFCLFFLDKSWQKIVQFFVVLRGNK